MILAVPIEDNSFDSKLSAKFARSLFFAIVDNNTKKIIGIIENPYCRDKSGVGKNVLNFLIKNNSVDTLIGFELGLKVHELAKSFNLNMIILNSKQKTLKNILDTMSINPKTM